ncbi:MAG: hypothetical protein JJT76_06920 [Clostridiaceae bacterium]|nr:hypothetical protein [Clostridiaceae bacterium]
MKTEIKSKVQKIIEAHKAANSGYVAEIEKWEKDTMYSDSYKKEMIKGFEQKIQENDASFNEQLKQVVQEEKAALIGAPKDKPADYQMQIANALEFIKLAGKNLTDDQAYGILKPFQGDVETMSLFQSVVGNYVEGGLDSRFTKTFEKTNNIIALENNFSTIESLSGNLLNSTGNNFELGIKSGIFMGNVDAIEKISSSIEE